MLDTLSLIPYWSLKTVIIKSYFILETYNSYYCCDCEQLNFFPTGLWLSKHGKIWADSNFIYQRSFKLQWRKWNSQRECRKLQVLSERIVHQLEKPAALLLPAGGQWMYSWFSMTTDRNFFIGFIMIGMKRICCMKLKFKGTWTCKLLTGH